MTDLFPHAHQPLDLSKTGVRLSTPMDKDVAHYWLLNGKSSGNTLWEVRVCAYCGCLYFVDYSIQEPQKESAAEVTEVQ